MTEPTAPQPGQIDEATLEVISLPADIVAAIDKYEKVYAFVNVDEYKAARSALESAISASLSLVAREIKLWRGKTVDAVTAQFRAEADRMPVDAAAIEAVYIAFGNAYLGVTAKYPLKPELLAAFKEAYEAIRARSDAAKGGA